jgi:hypothetical protein
MEDVGIFFVHLVNFLAIRHILWPFGIFSPVLIHFFLFWYVAPRKIWQPCSATQSQFIGSTLVKVSCHPE